MLNHPYLNQKHPSHSSLSNENNAASKEHLKVGSSLPLTPSRQNSRLSSTVGATTANNANDFDLLQQNIFSAETKMTMQQNRRRKFKKAVTHEFENQKKILSSDKEDSSCGKQAGTGFQSKRLRRSAQQKVSPKTQKGNPKHTKFSSNPSYNRMPNVPNNSGGKCSSSPSPSRFYSAKMMRQQRGFSAREEFKTTSLKSKPDSATILKRRLEAYKQVEPSFRVVRKLSSHKRRGAETI